jgi:D-alanyl-lipoteichoic acid acyltransferase DltB (MBOAT superfamily)
MTILVLLQERSVQNGKYALNIYICYLIYAPLYLAGPIISFNAFASQVCEFSAIIFLPFVFIIVFCLYGSGLCDIRYG